jgi:hypothetical protein
MACASTWQDLRLVAIKLHPFSQRRDGIAQIGHVHRRQIHEQFLTFLVRRIQYRRRHFVAEQRFETRRFAAAIEGTT